MLVIPAIANWPRLSAEVESVPLTPIVDGAGSAHLGDTEGWISGLAMARVNLADMPYLATAVTQLRSRVDLGDVVQVMVNKLRAGGKLDRHRDGFPDHDRFHLPIITHRDVYWWDERGGSRHMQPEWWYGPVPYCGILHSVGNPSPIDRIHVVIDFTKGNT